MSTVFIHLSFPKAHHVFIEWLLLSRKYLSVKHLHEEMLHLDYKIFEQHKFKHKLEKTIQNESVKCYYELEKAFMDILNK